MAIRVIPAFPLTVYENQNFISRHFINPVLPATGTVFLSSYTITTTASPCSPDFASGVTVSIDGTSLTISGRYERIFIDEDWDVRNAKMSSQVTTYDSYYDLPDRYWGVTKFIADQRIDIDVTINIDTNFGSTSLSQRVRNDWSTKRNLLLDAIYRGDADKNSISRDVLLLGPGDLDSVFAEEYSTSITYSVGTGTFTVPAGVVLITVEALGGGGGGGSGNENNGEHGGGGGGSGGYQITDLFVTPGDVLNWQVGAGGAGLGSVYTGTAESGGDTFFGAVISTGGAGGTAETNGTSFGKGGAGGSPNGLPGDDGTYGAGSAFGGKGADSPAGIGTTAPLGTGGVRGSNTNGALGNGGNATGFGAGGGGGGARDETGTPAANPGGAGAPGWLRITFVSLGES